MTGWLDDLREELREKVTEEDHPEWTSPMLATLTDDRFDDENWIYERKLDGVRLLAFRDGDRVRLLSRSREDQNPTYPEIVDALAELDPTDFVADGEVVAFSGDVTSFSRLQGRMRIKDEEEARETDIAVYLYLFDLLHLDGRDVTGLPLEERKALLRGQFSFPDPLRYTRHRRGEGIRYWEEACEKGWEGVIAKRADSTYVHSRSKDWLKFKCVDRQELVIGGYTEPEGERIGFGALLVGYHEGDELVYAGKVGTGFDDETLERLSSRLESRERKTQPFAEDDRLPSGDEVHWVTPDLVAEVGFTEWTHEGSLRHPRFVGLREDKDPEEVVRERPEGAES